MNKARVFLILGILVAILPYLGFPSAWKDNLFTIFGLIIIYFSYRLYKEYKVKEGKKVFDNFSENKHFHENKMGDMKEPSGAGSEETAGEQI